MLLYRSKYLFVNYLEVQYLFHIKFLPETKNISSNELKAEFMLFIDKMVNRRGRHFLFDIENIEHIFDTEFIKWFETVIFPSIKSIKTDKIAWLIKDKKQNELSIEKYINEKIEQKIFFDSKEAMDWLLKDTERKRLSFEDGKTPPSHHKHN